MDKKTGYDCLAPDDFASGKPENIEEILARAKSSDEVAGFLAKKWIEEHCPSSTQITPSGSVIQLVSEGETVQQGDGPSKPQHFQWQGVKEKIPPIQHHLISIMWDRKPRDEDDVVEAVWGSKELKGDSSIRTAVSRVNRVFEDFNAPLIMRRLNGQITLERKAL